MGVGVERYGSIVPVGVRPWGESKPKLTPCSSYYQYLYSHMNLLLAPLVCAYSMDCSHFKVIFFLRQGPPLFVRLQKQTKLTRTAGESAIKYSWNKNMVNFDIETYALPVSALLIFYWSNKTRQHEAKLDMLRFINIILFISDINYTHTCVFLLFVKCLIYNWFYTYWHILNMGLQSIWENYARRLPYKLSINLIACRNVSGKSL